jgi:AAHS family benzoate transporter-like MFS transporter
MPLTLSGPVVHRTPPSVLLLCLACLIFESYDVTAFGATVPFLLADSGWGITVAQAGVLGSLTPVGMLVGAASAGLLTDRWGRRRLIHASLALFSVAMIASGLVPGVALFGIARFVVGIGVGGILPSAAALVYEYAPAGRRNVNSAIAHSGLGLGTALAALTAAVLAPSLGFRVVYLVGGAAGLVVLSLAMPLLPESLVLLRGRGRVAEAERWAQRLGLDPALATARPEQSEGAGPGRSTQSRFALLFTARYRTLTLLFSVATFLSLLVLFGIYTWLPQLMRSTGYEVGSALTFLVVLGIGTAVGPLFLGRVADRIGSRPTIAASFLLAVIGISALSQPLPGWLLYSAVVLAGIGTVGTQILLNMLIASRYPVQVRATAIGFALSAGRIGGILGPVFGSLLLTAHLPTTTLFLAFAAPAVLGALIVAVIPRAVAEPAPDPVAVTAPRVEGADRPTR